VPEQHIDEIRARMAVAQLSVEVSTQATRTAATGRLFFINNQIDATTGTIELLAHFNNDDERLVPGQFIRARILLSTIENAVLVPSRAVQINQTGRFLWVVGPKNTAELRTVTTGPEDGDNLAIKQGLKPGERVVTDGQLRLFPDARVLLSDGNAAQSTGGGSSKRPEPARTLYSTPGHDDTGCGGNRHFRRRCPWIPADRGIAQCRFPDCRGVGQFARRRSPRRWLPPWRRRWRISFPRSPAFAR
jgi:multidrug efflux system membrane fusion protein